MEAKRSLLLQFILRGMFYRKQTLAITEPFPRAVGFLCHIWSWGFAGFLSGLRRYIVVVCYSLCKMKDSYFFILFVLTKCSDFLLNFHFFYYFINNTKKCGRISSPLEDVSKDVSILVVPATVVGGYKLNRSFRKNYVSHAFRPSKGVSSITNLNTTAKSGIRWLSPSPLALFIEAYIRKESSSIHVVMITLNSRSLRFGNACAWKCLIQLPAPFLNRISTQFAVTSFFKNVQKGSLCFEDHSHLVVITIMLINVTTNGINLVWSMLLASISIIFFQDFTLIIVTGCNLLFETDSFWVRSRFKILFEVFLSQFFPLATCFEWIRYLGKIKVVKDTSVPDVAVESKDLIIPDVDDTLGGTCKSFAAQEPSATPSVFCPGQNETRITLALDPVLLESDDAKVSKDSSFFSVDVTHHSCFQ